MPFKSGKSPTDVSRKIKKALEVDLPKNVERGLFTMYTILSGTADSYVPVDTSALVQSRTYRIAPFNDGFRLTYGYYTNYAQFLHEDPNWSPRPPNTRGKKGGGYNPEATYNWMARAWQEVGDDAMKAFAREVEPK